MRRIHAIGSVLAVAVLLGAAHQARASDGTQAVADFEAACKFAIECCIDTGDDDACEAYRHAHAAYKFASSGVANNDKADFYRAYLAGRKAAVYANDAYEQTGDIDAHYATTYAVVGSRHAYLASK